MNFFNKYKIVFVLLAFILGILIHPYFSSYYFIFLLLIPILLTTFFLTGKELLFIIVFIPIGFVLTAHSIKVDTINPNLINKKVSISGTLLKNPEKRKNSYRLITRINSINENKQINSGATIYIKETPVGLYSGSSIIIKNIKLKEISDFKNPGSFRLKNHFKNQGLLYTAFINDLSQIEKLDESSNRSIIQGINKFRKNYENFVREKIQFPNNEILIALTIGEKGGIPDEIRDKFSRIGIAHLLAISGLHIGIISLVTYFLIIWLLKRSTYLLLMYQVHRIASILTILPILLFTTLAGFATPVVRAFIMITLYLLAVFLGKHENKINILAAAALIILIFDPADINTLSFQLSFSAVGGILLFNNFYPLKFSSYYEKILSLIKTTVAATLFTLPLVINSFGYFPIASIPANLVAVPITEIFIVPIGFISILLFSISPSLSTFALTINEKVINILIAFAEKIATLDITHITVPNIDILGYFLLSLAFICLLLSNKFSKSKYIGIILIALFSINLFQGKPNLHNNLAINFLDTGKKTYMLINIPDGKRILIGVGYSHYGDSNFIEKAAVVPFLLKKGIKKIDYLWLFSTDKSILNGANTIIDRIQVDTIWTNGPKLNSDLWEKIKEDDIKWKNIENGIEQFSINKTKFEFIKHLQTPNYFDYRYPRQLILLITDNKNKLLISSGLQTINKQSEESEYYSEIVDSDTLFLSGNNRIKNQHLSKFIEAVSPNNMITGSSKNIPNSLTLDKLDNEDIYISEKDGMITVYSLSDKILIEKWE